MTFPDPRDIRRRGGQVPADYQDGKWREALQKRALYKDGPYVRRRRPASMTNDNPRPAS